MPPSKVQRAITAERRTKLIKMRRAGHDFEEIAQALGYSSRGAASRDLIRALEERRDEQEAETTVYRQESRERLLALLASVWPAATGGEDLKATEQARKIIADLNRLDGVDMPVRAEVSGPGGGNITLSTGSLAELNALIGLTGNGDSGAAGPAGGPSEGEDPDGDGDSDDG